MKLTIPRKDLYAALLSAGRCVSSHTSLPVLKNILVTPNGDRAAFAATNLEVGVSREAEANINTAGDSVSVPAKALSEIVAALPEGDVTISSEDNRWITLSAGRSEYKLATLPPEDFPSLPEVTDAVELRLPGKLLADSLKKVLVAVSKDETRPILTGVQIAAAPGRLTFVATDTHRLHVCPVALESIEGDSSWIVPSYAATEIAREVAESDEVVLRFNQNQIEATAPGWRFVSRLIEGKFPLYERVVPQRESATTTLTAPRSDLIGILKRALIVAKDAAAAGRVILTAGEPEGVLSGSGQTLTVTAEAGEMGKAREELEITLEGNPITFAVNAKFLIESLEVLEGEGATLRLTDPLAPILAMGDGDMSCTVMGMQIQ